MWTEDDVLEPEPHWPSRNTISLQIGAYDNLIAGIYRDFWQCLEGRSFTIDVGRPYQIRAEVDEQMFRLYLDGKLIAQFDQLFPTPSGYIGIYSYSPGKAFSNIRLFERSMPERISPTAVGDAFYLKEDYASAAVEYTRVELRLPGTELADEACFKHGLCELKKGQLSLAEGLWSNLRADAWRTRASLHLLDREFEARNHPEVVRELDRLLTDTHGSRALVVDRWVQYVNSLFDSDFAPLAQYGTLRDRHFPDDPGSAGTAAQLEYRRGNYRLVIERYPEQHPLHFEALCALGEFTRASERYRTIPWMYEMSQLYLNEFDSIQQQDVRALVQMLRGDLEGSLAIGQCAETLLYTGQYDALLKYRFSSRTDHAAALRAQGKLAEAAALGDGRALCQLDVGAEVLNSRLVLHDRLYVLQHLALRSFVVGDIVAYRRYSAEAAETPCSAISSDVWIPRHFLFPILESESGDAEAFRRSAARVIDEFALNWRAKAYYLARFVLGEIDLAEFKAQPVRLFMQARSALARALRAELLCEANAAVESYCEFLELPDRDRFSDSPWGDPLVERWAAFRVERLRRT